MKNFLFGVIVALLFSLCAYFYIENKTLNSRVSTLEQENKIITNENFQKVKEDYYIQQQNRDITLVLFTVTTLFLIFGAITFLSVKSEFKSQIEMVETKFSNQALDYQKSMSHIKNLEGDLSFEAASNLTNKIMSLYRIEYTKIELVTMFELTLISCEYYAKCLLSKPSVSLKFKVSIIGSISGHLKELKRLAENNNENIELINLGYDRFTSVKNTLEQIIEQEDSRDLAFIFSKLSFPDLD